jgi:predicted nucleic acid-binding protein
MFKHKDAIVHASGLGQDEVLEALHVLLENIRFLKEVSISIGTWTEAYRLCRDVDPKDTPYVAVALHLEECRLWTFDRELREGLCAKGWSQFFPGVL